jgi:hypothetical protein
MSSKFLLLAMVFSCLMATAQSQVNIGGGQNLQALNGAPLTPDKVLDLQGSYFFNDEFLPAILVDASGKEYKDKKIKFNLKSNIIYYTDWDGKLMQATSDIRKVIITEPDKTTVFENFFPSIDGLDAGTYYKVLISGSAKLLLSTQFSEAEYKEFNSAVTTKRVDKVYQLYGAANGNIKKLTKGEAEILELLKDKSSELASFIKQNSLKCRKQSDYETVFNYYNGLKK